MKKTSFFYTLILGLIVSFCFNSCKDPVVEPVPQPTDNVLKSKSFEVLNLEDSVTGLYIDKTYQPPEPATLTCSYIIHNITNDTVKYNIKLEKIQTVEDHWIQYCAGSNCYINKVKDLKNIWETTTNDALYLASDKKTNPNIDSYIKLWSGKISYDPNVPSDEAKIGLNKFRITYYNIEDKSDYVSFVLTFNFTE